MFSFFFIPRDFRFHPLLWLSNFSKTGILAQFSSKKTRTPGNLFKYIYIYIYIQNLIGKTKTNIHITKMRHILKNEEEEEAEVIFT